MSNGKDRIILLIAGLIKRTYKMSQFFPPYRCFGKYIKMELDLSSYATKTDLKNVTHVDISNFPAKTNRAILKTKVDKLDVDKLVPVPNDLAKLSNAVKNDVVKKTEYNKLVTKVNGIDTTIFFKKLNTKKMDQVLMRKSIR